MKINDERVKDITILVDGYIVGGAVRDYLLGKPIYDWDISTPKTPDEVIKLLQDNGFKTILTGAKYGTVSTIVDGIQHPVEITTFRSEKYNNSRFPEVVYHTTQKGDSMRRDFTINAMAYDVRNDKILDYYGGMEDIKSRTIRFVGEPIERIKEDPLRIIRACRIAATLGFRMDEDTSNALMEMRDLLSTLSQDRLVMEIKKANLYLRNFFMCLMKHHLTQYVFGYDFTETLFMEHDNRGSHYGESIYKHTLDALERADKIGWHDFALRIAILYHDVGKLLTRTESNGSVHFIGHENVSTEIFGRTLGSFTGMDKKTKNQIEFLIQNHMMFPLMETKHRIIKSVVDWKMNNIPFEWIDNQSKLAYADRGIDYTALMDKIRKVFAMPQPDGNDFLKYEPTTRKEHIRQVWIEKLHNEIEVN